MTNERVRSVGGYLMRLVGGVAIILGILGVFTGLSQPNLVGVVLGVVFIVGGAVMIKRSGGGRQAGKVATTPGSTR